MNVLLVGSGGREHALAWRLAKSEKCDALFCAPGNAGIADIAECIDIAADDIDGIVLFATENSIDFVVVGPEVPLVAGLADPLREKGIPVFGPSKAASILEGSKAYMKDFFKKYDIPTAAYGRFTDFEEAKSFIEAQNTPIVIKTDGLAAGKGVLICQTHEEAIEAAQNMLSGASFGGAGREIVVEEFLNGIECSFFALSDGETVIPLTSAQDYKKIGDGDTGLNTGGMGAYSPAYLMDSALQQKIMDRIILPTVHGMKTDGRPFQGVLFAGLMIVNGEPFTIEYNIRFGDPECQVMMPRLKNDLLEVLYDAATGNLQKYIKDELEWTAQTVLTVVMAADGYPGSYQKGNVIKNVIEAGNIEAVQIFHAGTARSADGDLVSNGGRVLNVTAAGASASEAKAKAYDAISKIDWPDSYYRKDIGWHAVDASKTKEAV